MNSLYDLEYTHRCRLLYLLKNLGLKLIPFSIGGQFIHKNGNLYIWNGRIWLVQMTATEMEST